MFLEKFYQTISKGPFGRWILRRSSAVAELDPERINVENVRSILGVPFAVARLVCKAGVREGTLLERYAYYCPNKDNHRVICISDTPLASDEKIKCEVCELKGDGEFTFCVSDVKMEKIYGFRKGQEGED